MAVSFVVVVHCQPDPLEVVLALHAPSGVARSFDGGNICGDLGSRIERAVNFDVNDCVILFDPTGGKQLFGRVGRRHK